MKKALKISGIVLLVLIAAMIILPIVFKGKIIQKVKDEINSSLNAKVDFSDFSFTLFSSFPDFTLKLNDLSIVGKDDFKNDTLAAIKTLGVSIDFMSVISGDKYVIKSINITKPKVLLKVLADGKANWDITKPSAPTPEAKKPEQASTFKLSLKKLSIEDAAIVYDDRSTHTYCSLQGMEHTLKGDFTADVTVLKTKTFVKQLSLSYGGITYLNKAEFEAKADIDADLKNDKYTFRENEFRFNKLILGLDGFVKMLKDAYDLDIKFSAKQTEFKNILSMVPAVYSKDFDKVETKGTFGLDAMAKGRYDSLHLPAFSINFNIKDAMFKYPSLPKAVNNINVAANIANKGGSADNTTIDVKKMHLEMGGNPLDASLMVSTPISDAQLNAKIKGKLDLSQVKDYYPLDKNQQLNGIFTADVTIDARMSYVDKKQYEKIKALGSLLIERFVYKSDDYPDGVNINKAQLDFSPAFLQLVALDIKMGKSDFFASVKLENYMGYLFKKEAITGNLDTRSTFFDVNQFTQSSTADTKQAAKVDTTKMKAVEVPGNINFTMNSSFGKIIYDKLELTNVKGIIIIKDKTINLQKLQMNTLDGQLSVNGKYSTTNPVKPKVEFLLDIAGFDIQKTYKAFDMIKKLAPIAEKTKGKFSANLSLNSAMDEYMNLQYGSLTSNGKLSTNNIVIENATVFSSIADALKINSLKKLEFNKINLSFEILNGKVFIKPFDVAWKNYKANIGGSMDLDQKIDYLIKFSFPRSEFGGQANSTLTSLLSQANQKGGNFSVGDIVNIDVIVGGTTTKPIIKTGLKGAMNNAVDEMKKKAEDEINKKKQEVENQVKTETDKLKKQGEDLKKQTEDKAKAEADRLKKEANDKAKKELEKQAKDKLPKLF
ncbi:MAG: AsmA-like C-terminal region-containing protein [Bacteroidota bacterium]